MSENPCWRHDALLWNIPRGNWNTFNLVQINPVPGARWPCEEHPDVFRHGMLHNHHYYPGHCHRAVALLCEEPSVLQMRIFMGRCCGYASVPSLLHLDYGMNILVYCLHNFTFGTLQLQSPNHTLLPVQLPNSLTGGAYVFLDCNRDDVFYDWRLGFETPVKALVVVPISPQSSYVIPRLITLSRLAIGEWRISHCDAHHLPPVLRQISYVFVHSMYSADIVPPPLVLLFDFGGVVGCRGAGT